MFVVGAVMCLRYAKKHEQKNRKYDDTDDFNCTVDTTCGTKSSDSNCEYNDITADV